MRPSFVPPCAIRQLRDLTRYRRKLSAMASSERNRIQKVLEDANIKLVSVLTDIFGVSGRRLIGALLDGQNLDAPASGPTLAWPAQTEIGHQPSGDIAGPARGAMLGARPGTHDKPPILRLVAARPVWTRTTRWRRREESRWLHTPSGFLARELPQRHRSVPPARS